MTTPRCIQDQAAAVVRERDRRRLRRMAGVLGLTLLLVALVLGYVWLQAQQVRLSYEIEDLRRLRAEIAAENEKLRLELASLRAYARVETAARRLGLARPTGDQVRLAREFVAEAPAAVARRAQARVGREAAP